MRFDAGTFSEGAHSGSGKFAPWYRSRAAWRFVFERYAPLLVAGNLAWEILHLPFYTIWQEGTPRSRLFAILHCTAGDLMIGTASLLVAVMLFGRHDWPLHRHRRVLGTAVLIGVAYTVFSEWVNTQVTMGWQYSETMLRIPPLGTGFTPLLQWTVIPPIAYWLARTSAPHQPRGGQAI